MKIMMTNLTYYIAASVGGGNIKMEDPTAKVNDLNNIFIKVGVAVGMVVLALGILKLLMSIADESPKRKNGCFNFHRNGWIFLGDVHCCKNI